MEKRKGTTNLTDRLVRLVLTLPIYMKTIEQALLAIKLVKTTLCNKMENELFFFFC